MGSYPGNSPEREHLGINAGLVANPEVLPPQSGSLPPQPSMRKPKPSWVTAPATYLLMGINCAVFVVMVLRGVSAGNPTVPQLMYFGADNAGNVLVFGEWWRIVAAMFVHVATNMWCLWNLGLLAEPLMGSFGVLAVYILTGAAGNLLSTCVNWIAFNHDWVRYHDVAVFPAGAGASGAVFGIAGALIVLLKSQQLPVPPAELKRLRKSVIYFAALNLVLGLSISAGTHVIGSGISIDNMAHVGGFACGLLFATPMVPRLGVSKQYFSRRLRIAVGLVMGILVLFGFFLAQLPGQG